MTPLASWGRLSRDPHEVVSLSDRRLAPMQVRPGGLAYGMGRSYGDACLNPGGTVWATAALDKFISFDESTGMLTAEAGVLLQAIQTLFVPRGWMLPVTPGTWYVTLGGAIANDVHGKNHHRLGSIGHHVESITLLRTDGQCVVLDRQSQPALLRATIGGLGLTGVILQASLRLRPVAGPWLDCESLPYGDLDEFFDINAASLDDWEYTVSWVDCLDSRRVRGIYLRANHAQRPAGPARHQRGGALGLPFTPPVPLVNPLSLRAFNHLYFTQQRWKRGRSVQHYQPFFYPLDALRDWNRMYGPRGFYQYQCVVPLADSREAVQVLLDRIARSGQGSFLSVLKTLGAREPAGMLSFPMEGTTLALDFPNRGESTLALFRELDAVVREAGGRLYPAKDARMPRDLFEAGYPELATFVEHRDPGITSAMSRRLLGW